MAISKLTISNFKGIADRISFELRPITLFIGPNSSGKSSCIHALAALAQTVKLPNSGRPLVLDDEYAQVHLGRFIEVIHSKSYSDAIGIGFETIADRIPRTVSRTSRGQFTLNANYSFRSTRRTQDVYLDRADFSGSSGPLTFKFDTKSATYQGKSGPRTIALKAPAATSLDQTRI